MNIQQAAESLEAYFRNVLHDPWAVVGIGVRGGYLDPDAPTIYVYIKWPQTYSLSTDMMINDGWEGYPVVVRKLMTSTHV